jgi:methanogenic corrinoid protein MtbC1
MDSQTLEQELARAAVSLSTTRLLEQLLIPLLRHIGDRWRAGAIRPSQEHLATAVVRSFLGSLASRQEMASGSPEILITTPAGQFHELGALMASVLAVLDGWRTTYLGPNLPAEEIAAAAKRREVRAVALSVVYSADPTQVIEELHKLRRLLDQDVAMIVGGAGSSACADALGEIGAIRVDEMSRFREELDRLRTGSPD